MSTTETQPSGIMRELDRCQRELIEEHIDEGLIKARTKSSAASTAAGKSSPYMKVLDDIGTFYGMLKDVTFLESLEGEIRQELDSVQLGALVEKAEKAEFKGQNKSAINAYLDALFFVKRDSINDVEQEGEIRKIEKKITDLGGTVPK